MKVRERDGEILVDDEESTHERHARIDAGLDAWAATPCIHGVARSETSSCMELCACGHPCDMHIHLGACMHSVPKVYDGKTYNMCDCQCEGPEFRKENEAIR